VEQAGISLNFNLSLEIFSQILFKKSHFEKRKSAKKDSKKAELRDTWASLVTTLKLETLFNRRNISGSNAQT